VFSLYQPLLGNQCSITEQYCLISYGGILIWVNSIWNFRMTNLDTDVLIVGGGPCGLMLANELGQRGIKTALYCDRAGTSPDPQANATQARTMEHFRRLGFVDVIRDNGLPVDYPTDISYFTRYTGYELARFKLPSSSEAKKIIKTMSGSWSAAELPHRISQMYVEQTLRNQAEKHACIDLNFSAPVISVTDHGDHVSATVEQNGTQKEVRARYLVGCDGPRSLVRKSLGIEYTGESGVVRDFFGGKMHAIYFRSKDLYDILTGEKSWMYWAFNEDRRSFLVALDGKTEFVYHTQLLPHEEDLEIDEAKARAMFAESFNLESEIEIISRNTWRAGFALVAEKFSQGNIFIAGDAAHLFTPTGGLGYNTAVEDAVNLGWKLAAVLKGWGGAQLLDTYHVERHKNGLRNTSLARGFADSLGDFKVTPELEDDTEAGMAARRIAGEYLDRHVRAEFNIPGITFGYRYDGSAVVVSDGTNSPPDVANDYVPTASPGGRAPHAWLDDGASLYDKFGFEFTLLRMRESADVSAFEKTALDNKIPLTVLDVFDEDLRTLYEADLALIRPDQIVVWRGDDGKDTAAIFSQVTGR
jgi:2-polyprenyl-6-methoxyphenol hydroxylase-like FAD-dependent oxidoreductase